MIPGGLTTARLRQGWALIAAIGLVWEFVGVGRPQAKDTLSELVDDVTAGFPVLPVAVGVVVGHMFWRRKRLGALLIGVGLGVLLWPVGKTKGAGS